MPHAHLRPTLTVRAAPRQWWRYALNALTFHGWVQRRFSWDTVKRVMDVRRAYVPLYSEYLEKPEAGDVSLRDRFGGRGFDGEMKAVNGRVQVHCKLPEHREQYGGGESGGRRAERRELWERLREGDE